MPVVSIPGIDISRSRPLRDSVGSSVIRRFSSVSETVADEVFTSSCVPETSTVSATEPTSSLALTVAHAGIHDHAIDYRGAESLHRHRDLVRGLGHARQRPLSTPVRGGLETGPGTADHRHIRAGDDGIGESVTVPSMRGGDSDLSKRNPRK